ncbi:unnamed protein product [Phytomonas sp. Hart1]|nr:unnamed protein product [Phytomonas sp. Hart1]|eukprot:CCW66777.1 unnamed protein product [Phytomonas sp. isolate Hart1]
MDPISFMEGELQQLTDAGIPYLERVGVGNVYIVTPFHKLIDLVLSEVNSSTLKGMSPAHAGKALKHGIRLNHIFNDEAVLRSQLRKGMDMYFGMLKQKNMTDSDVVRCCEEANSGTMKRVPPHVVEFATAEDKIEYLVKLYRTRVRENPAFPKRCDVVQEMAAAIGRGEKVLLEGPQSFWLSNGCEKFWVSSTSANTSAIGLLAASQLNFQRVKTVVINVHKAPASSRVGIGACPSSFVVQDFFSVRNIRTLHELPKDICTDFDAIQSLFFNHAFPYVEDPARFNGIPAPIEYADGLGTYHIGAAMAIASSTFHGEFGAVTRKPRICGFFDCVLHHEVNAFQGPYLAISALDRGDAYDRLGITIAYVYYSPTGVVCEANGRRYQNGDIIRSGDPVPSEGVLAYCHPIVKLVKGWRDAPIASTKRERGAPLPPALCEFLSTIEHFTGCKVLSIGNGPGGDDNIYLNQS